VVMHGPPDPPYFNAAPQAEQKRRDLATTDPRIRRALELLHVAHTVGVTEIASSLNLSESRFRHLFKKELGVSPMHYFKLIQLNRARGLLEHSFLTIKEIAAVVGVNDISHFVRDYKALYRQTPSQTRGASRRQRMWNSRR